jgi:hypothetical protein
VTVQRASAQQKHATAASTIDRQKKRKRAQAHYIILCNLKLSFKIIHVTLLLAVLAAPFSIDAAST